jgi:hypothetical protein
VPTGGLPRWQVLRIRIDGPEADRTYAKPTPRQPAHMSSWECIDLAATYNDDIRTIFQQKCLSSRPETCLFRIGTDSYSAWTFPYWGLTPPAIGLDAVTGMKDSDGRIVTPQDVPFAPWSKSRNVAFLALGQLANHCHGAGGIKVATVWLLVAESTFPMQTGIANAVVRFAYADGTIDLIPPANFWILSTWGGVDYDVVNDAHALPSGLPTQVQLRCRLPRDAALVDPLHPGVILENVTLETLSEEVVIRLMGLSIEHSSSPAD